MGLMAAPGLAASILTSMGPPGAANSDTPRGSTAALAADAARNSRRLMLTVRLLARGVTGGAARRASRGDHDALLEQPRREVREGAAPRQPFVRRARRLEIDVVDAGLRELVAEVLDARSFDRSGADEHQLDLFIERGGIGEGPAARRLRIEGAASAEPRAIAAEAAEVAELVEV